MFAFLSAIPWLKALLPYLQKYWKHAVVAVAVVVAIIMFGNWRADQGYNAASVVYLKQLKDQADAKTNAYNEIFGKYQQAMADKQAAEDKLKTASTDAEKASKEFQVKVTIYQQQLAEARKHVPTKTADTPPLTYGFVGLYNLAIRGPDPTKPAGYEVSLPDILSAAGVVDGTATFDLSQSSGVTVDDVIEVNSYNSSITNQCLKDRALMKGFIDDVCSKGLCK